MKMNKIDYLRMRSNKMVSVFGLLEFDGKYLFVNPSYKEGWVMVGGGVDPGEHPKEACKREFKEEVGLEIEVGNLKQISSKKVYEAGASFDLITMIFEVSCEDISDLKVDGEEIIDAEWLRMDEIEDYLRNSNVKRLRNLDKLYFEFD